MTFFKEAKQDLTTPRRRLGIPTKKLMQQPQILNDIEDLSSEKLADFLQR